MLQAVCSHSCGVHVLLTRSLQTWWLMCTSWAPFTYMLYFTGIHPTTISDSFQKAAVKATEVLTEMSTPVTLEPWVPPQEYHHFAQLKGRYIHVNVYNYVDRKMHLPAWFSHTFHSTAVSFTTIAYRYCNSWPSEHPLPRSHTLVCKWCPSTLAAGSTLSGRCAQSDWPRHCY